MTKRRGRFVVFEGIDGAGKSLQTERLMQHLRQRNIDCLATREPGGAPLGETMRAWLKHSETDALTQALLFNAARREHVRTLIAPALERGAWVLSDRFALSGFAYQRAGGADLSQLEALHSIATGDLGASAVDLGFVLDLQPSVAQARMRQGREKNDNQKERGERAEERDVFERRGLAFFRRVRDLLLERARLEGEVWHILDADASIEEVAKQVNECVERRFFAA